MKYEVIFTIVIFKFNLIIAVCLTHVILNSYKMSSKKLLFALFGAEETNQGREKASDFFPRPQLPGSCDFKVPSLQINMCLQHLCLWAVFTQLLLVSHHRSIIIHLVETVII